MAHRVVWSPRALSDVETIASYISVDSSNYASTVVRRILMSTRQLANFPSAGRVVPEFDDETIREVFAFDYRIIYRVEEDEVIVVAVIHGKRLI